jgi:hypothetical protein
VDRDVRKANNESLFREVNERVEDTAIKWGTAENRIAFLCECSDLECTTRIELTVPQYEHVRAEPTQFFVAHGHMDPEVEAITETFPSYDIVTKHGQAAARAEADDPRS